MSILTRLFNTLKYKYASGKIDYSENFSLLSKVLYNKSLFLSCENAFDVVNFIFKLSYTLDELLNRRLSNIQQVLTGLNDKPNLLISKKIKFSNYRKNSNSITLRTKAVYRHILYPTLAKRLKFHNKNYIRHNIIFNVANRKKFRQNEVINHFYEKTISKIKSPVTKIRTVLPKSYFLKQTRFKPPVYVKPLITRIPERFLKASAYFNQKRYDSPRKYENRRTYIQS